MECSLRANFLAPASLLRLTPELVSRLRPWKAPLFGFVVGQPALQLVNLVTGLLLLRWMSIEHYAQFGVAFAFQSTVAMLADLGFSSSILALAGERAGDSAVLGKYLRSARHYRTLLVCIVLVGFAIGFPLITASQPWPPIAKSFIFGSIVFAVLVQGWTMYQAPLLANRQVAAVYRPQVVVGSLRLLFCGALYSMHTLTGVAASWVGSLALGLSGWWIKHRAQPFVVEPRQSDPIANREMLRYLAPLFPGVIFTAFQAQISIGIITLLGTTQNIAEVAALGRLGQLFGILSAFNGVIIGPYIAALAASRLRRRYFQIVAAAVLLSTAISLLAFQFPDPLLWLLGPHYRDLRETIGWVVLTGCLSYICGVMWTIHSVRRWVFWWGSLLYIVLLIAAQVLGIKFLNLSSTMGVVYFGVASAVAVLIVQIATAVFGLFFYRRP